MTRPRALPGEPPSETSSDRLPGPLASRGLLGLPLVPPSEPLVGLLSGLLSGLSGPPSEPHVPGPQ